MRENPNWLADAEEPELSIVIPAYNEGQRIRRTLLAAAAYLNGAGRDSWASWEIIVVGDGCTDDTEASVSAALVPQIRYVSYPENRGKGYALRFGVARTRGDFVLFTDADGSVPIEELARVRAQMLGQQAQIAIASRNLESSTIVVRQPLHRRILGRCFSAFTRIAVGMPIHDTQCGFKLFQGDVARALFAAASCDAFAIDLEILLLAQRFGWAVTEVGVVWIADPESRVRPVRDGLRMLGDSVLARRRAAQSPVGRPSLLAVNPK